MNNYSVQFAEGALMNATWLAPPVKVKELVLIMYVSTVLILLACAILSNMYSKYEHTQGNPCFLGYQQNHQTVLQLDWKVLMN